MHAGATETLRTTNPIRKDSPGRRIVFNNGNGYAHTTLTLTPGGSGMSVISFHDIETDLVVRVSQDSSDFAPWQTVFRRVAGRRDG
jgi:hypothetical protein